MPRRRRRSASVAHRQRVKEVEGILAVVQCQLAENKKRFAESGKEDWGFVGDLGHLSELLCSATLDAGFYGCGDGLPPACRKAIMAEIKGQQ
jgi:hypothetical protein